MKNTSTLTEHQYKIYEAITREVKHNLSSVTRSDDIEDHLLSLSGAAGVGKSYLTTQIIKGLIDKQHNKSKIYVTAPTNKAVEVLRTMLQRAGVEANCKTIHSFLSLRPSINYTTGKEEYKALKTKKHKPLQASLLIIDESSMVSQELYRFIINSVERGHVNTVLFIGDPYQLLPINQNENVIYKLKKLFKLTEIVRQAKDSNIITLATKLRERIQRQDFISLKELLQDSSADDITFFKDKELLIKDFYKNNDWHLEDKIFTSYTNSTVETVNKRLRDYYWIEKGIANPSPYLAGDRIRFKGVYNNLGAASKIKKPILYQNGDEVTLKDAQLLQDDKLGIMYWRCTVIGRREVESFKVISSPSINRLNTILENYKQQALTSPKSFAREYWKHYYDLKNAFANIQYIHASTIHKLQGSTYDTVYIDIGDLINANYIPDNQKYRLLYVAITRARKHIKIFY